MAICSYLVLPVEGATEALSERLGALPGCEVLPAENHDLIILVTDTPGPAEERALRERLDGVDGIRALFLTFGEIDPDTSVGDPLAEAGRDRPASGPAQILARRRGGGPGSGP